MKNSPFVRCVTGVLVQAIALAALGTVVHAQTVGRTPGTFTVSPTGAATYAIPIFAPPGPHGLQPNIALAYNSQSGNGYVGVGWNLAGLSAITRCNLTYAQDAAPSAITLSYSDVFCLDGKRLRLTSSENLSTYGQDGTTYQTELADFSNVTAHGSAGNGPAYFTVQTGDGHTLQYGNGGNSQVMASGTALEWMLNKVSDPAGNTMTISYSTINGQSAVVPSVISWTPTSAGATTYAYTMTFNYGTNQSNAGGSNLSNPGQCLSAPSAPGTNLVPLVCILNGYVAGAQIQEGSLLNSITIDYSGSQVKEYVLSYTQSGTTGRDVLTQLQECATSTSNCLYPTTMSYQPGSAGVSSSATVAVSTSLTPCIGSGSVARYDFNGDGYTDLLYKVGSTCYVAFGSASGYGTPVNTGISPALAGDLLGSGSAGLLANSGGTWYYYTWNGSSFIGTSTGLAYDTTANEFALADINGDGLPDLVTLHGAATITTRLNTSSGGTPSFSGSLVTAYSDSSLGAGLIYPDVQPGNARFFDFNGDGRQDLVLEELTCVGNPCQQYLTTVKELISQTGGTFSATVLAQIPTNTFFVAFANVNDDGCTDAILGQAGGTVSEVLLSDCNGGVASTLTSTYPVVTVMDWNGDGLADLVEENNGTLYVQLSTATGLTAATATSLSYSGACTYTTFDANGDGLDDLGCSSSSGFSYYLHNGAGQPPDLLSSIVDGYGNSAAPTYESIIQGDYANYYISPTYPQEIYMAPIYVAKKVTFSDPSNPGGTYYQTYNYIGSTTNVQGRGFCNFSDYQRYDSRNALWETFGVESKFPFCGNWAAYYATQDQAQTEPYYLWYRNHALTTLDATQYNERYFPYDNGKTAKHYQDSWNASSGNSAGPLIETDTDTYSFDNYGNPTSIATTRTDNDSNSPYNGQSWTTTTTNTPDVNTGTWCLNLLTETQVAYSSTLSGSGSVTRTKQFTPDTTACHYTQIITEPSSPQYKVTETLGYTDSFGNITSDTITGVGMTARTTLITWANSTYTTGQFPLSVTDPSGATTQVAYNYGFGLPSSMTDPNQLTTSWGYDPFGRKNQENRPDGTYTTVNLYDAANSGLNFHGLITQDIAYASNGTLVSARDLMTDSQDRAFASASMLLSGAYSRTDIRYDNLNRRSSQSFPCTYSSWSTPCTTFATYSYDMLNRVTEAQRPISSTNGNLQTTTYSHSGRTETITDPYYNTRTIIDDVNGWLRETKDAYGYAVTLAYDSAGSKTGVTDSESNTLWSGSYGYGLSAFLTSETDMDRGAWSYTIDALGERTAWTDAKAQSFGESYDALSRPSSRSEPDLFTQWTWGSTPSSHNVGKLASVCTGQGSSPTNCTSSPGYSEAETYDSVGRLYQRAITLPSAGTFTYTSQYSSTTGLLSSLTYPTSTYSCQLVVNYGYTNGILSSLTDGSNQTNCGSTGTVFWQANTQNADGQITEETLGNGIVINRTYDAVTHWLGSLQAGVGGGSGVKNLSFLFDEMGNVIQRQDGNLSLTESIHYDDDYRLSYTDLGNTQNLSIGYDLNGNITSRSDVASGASWTYSPTHKHEVTEAGSSSYTYSYDANGNMNSRQGNTIGWSSYNYPTSISAGSGSTAESVSLYYGPDRQRWYQYYTGNATTEGTYYVGKAFEVVSSGTNQAFRHYIYADNEPVAVLTHAWGGKSGTIDYVLSDHQGSVSALTNSSGGVVVNESFTPYGNRRNPSTWSGAASNSDLTTAAGITRQAYTFQTQLGLWMGMNHMNGRVEDSITGRFLSADPNIPNVSSAQDYNRYSYVDNNPLTYTDPTGFDPPDVRCISDCTVNITAPGDAQPEQSTPNNTPGLAGQTSNNNNGKNGGDKNPPEVQGPPQTVTVTAPKKSTATVAPVNVTLQTPTGPNPCGSTNGIPEGETLIPANPSSGIFTAGSHTVLVQGPGSQVQVALTNISGVAPAVIVAEVSFNAGTVALGDSGQDILTGTTATFRSDTFGVLGPTPLTMNVNIDIKNDAGAVSAQFCTVGAAGLASGGGQQGQ